MTINCNCDMPWGVYLDWLEDQGWDTSELRMLTDADLTMISGSSVCTHAHDHGCALGTYHLLGYAPYTMTAYGDGYAQVFVNGTGEGAVVGNGHDELYVTHSGNANGGGSY